MQHYEFLTILFDIQVYIIKYRHTSFPKDNILANWGLHFPGTLGDIRNAHKSMTIRYIYICIGRNKDYVARDNASAHTLSTCG